MQALRPYLPAAARPSSAPTTRCSQNYTLLHKHHISNAVDAANAVVAASVVIGPAPLPTLAPSTSHIESPNQSEDLEALAKAAGVQRLVRCGPTPLGRGLIATQKLERQTLVSVPIENALVITDEPLSGISIFGDRCLEVWQEAHGHLPPELVEFLTGEARWDVRMTAWLLWVASELPDSPIWGPYVSNLPPAEEVTCLINYGPDDAKELQNRQLIEEAKSQYAWSTGVHRKFFDSERGELRRLRLAASQVDTLWAMSMVRTRTFSETVNGEALTLMVPYADLANHSFRHNSTFCMAQNKRRFELRLLTKLGVSQEATISYGEAKPNYDVMRDYGFVVPGNPNDRVPLPQQDTLPALNGASLLDSIGFKGDWREGTAAPKRPTLEASDGDVEARLTLARRRCVLLSLNLADGIASSQHGGGIFGAWPPKPWTDSGRAPPQPVPALAAAPERANVAIVRQSYQAALAELPTSIETDTELLSGHESGLAPLSGRVAAAVRCRLEHKLLLREAVRLLDEYDNHLAKLQR